MDGSQLGQGAPGGMPQGGMPPNGMGGPPGGPGGFLGFLPGGPITSVVILGLFVVTLVVLAVVFYKLFQKAGFAGVLGLLMLVPVVNLGVALYLAFAEWPVLTELSQLKLLAASTAPPATVATPEAASPQPHDPSTAPGT